jgi:hypothetical protein
MKRGAFRRAGTCLGKGENEVTIQDLKKAVDNKTPGSKWR